MKKKILILLMSCNKDLYKEEEAACCETFLKDAEGAGIPYYFYKSGESQSIDNENHIMYLPVPDGLGGTSRKTVAALQAALNLDYDWDYVVKTNVSTWIDIEKLNLAACFWEGKEDTNVYGARFIVNPSSKHVPFPRGHFVILSRKLVEGLLQVAPKLLGAEGFPKTDDTLLCLSLLYYIQKGLGLNYLDSLREVPSVNSYPGDESVEESLDWGDALSVRCKNEEHPEKTPENMGHVQALKKLQHCPNKQYRRKMGLVETPFGMLPYSNYEKVWKVMKEKEKAAANKDFKEENGVVKRANPEDKLAEIRKKLEGGGL